jgi:hypothetical protein
LGGPADAGIAQVWEAEITRRLDDLQSGDVQTIEADKALCRIDARLRHDRFDQERAGDQTTLTPSAM